MPVVVSTYCKRVKYIKYIVLYVVKVVFIVVLHCIYIVLQWGAVYVHRCVYRCCYCSRSVSQSESASHLKCWMSMMVANGVDEQLSDFDR